MKQSHVVILSVVFILVIGLYFIQKRPHHVEPNELFEEVIPEFDIDSIDSIKVWTPKDKSGHPFHIVKKDHSYWIEVYEDGTSFLAPCQESRVKRLLESLRGLRGEERAKGEDHFDTFLIGDKNALHLELKSGDRVICHILVGKRGEAWGTSFVRKVDDDSVLIVRKNMLSLVEIWQERAAQNPSPTSWIDLGVIKDDSSEVEGVSYSTSDEVWSLTSSGNETSEKGKWLLVQDGAQISIDEDKAKEFLRSIFPLYAKSVRDPSKIKDFGLSSGENFGRFTIHYRTKGLKIIHIGKIDKEKKVGWIRDNRGVIFEVSSDLIHKIQTGPVLEKKEEASHSQEQN
ncbi:hypothetical protein DBT_1269 [Dissulfuribacter thermophilus]|uniref:DUF4340 domain-containing protein n=1 Tax=Dissulfuribacter thermophilus TaxID=1156395 RepID=A0A1B9F5D5_9BACT|nr:DUF4340 domain-containing protein [Dissulfuribacter thermophilus]OCC15149.1 hypothetical protein DBT_1269 [Dissulfuribacter thermophilus]